jgi:hypothetical protein
MNSELYKYPGEIFHHSTEICNAIIKNRPDTRGVEK